MLFCLRPQNCTKGGGEKERYSDKDRERESVCERERQRQRDSDQDKEIGMHRQADKQTDRQREERGGILKRL